MACGEARFDGRLSPAEPVEGGVDVVGGGVADAEFVGEGGGLPVAWHGQLGAGKEDARGDKGQGELPLWRRPRGEQGVKAQGTDGAEDGADMAVGAGACDAEGLPGGDEGLPLEGAADEVDEVFREVREVGQSTMADARAVAVGVPEQMGDVSLASVFAGNRGHVHAERFARHAGNNR